VCTGGLGLVVRLRWSKLLHRIVRVIAAGSHVLVVLLSLEQRGKRHSLVRLQFGVVVGGQSCLVLSRRPTSRLADARNPVRRSRDAPRQAPRSRCRCQGSISHENVENPRAIEEEEAEGPPRFVFDTAAPKRGLMSRPAAQAKPGVNEKLIKEYVGCPCAGMSAHSFTTVSEWASSRSTIWPCNPLGRVARRP
jgi:hypothetical protein